VEGWLEEVSRKLNQTNVSDHNAGIRAYKRTAIVEGVQTKSGWSYLQTRRSCLSQESRSMTA
jgi:hypothetical protein